MKKSVYSMVLADDIVERIDRLAYMRSTTRSALVNEILAEYASVTTPEMRMRAMIGRIEALLSGGGEIRPAESRSDSMLTLRSALAFKYNPTVRYSVVLYKNEYPAIGELRVGFRTQNRDLLTCMDLFYRAWIQIEESYIGGGDYRMEDGRFVRRLVLRRNPGAPTPDTDTLGTLIAEYVRVFDESMKIFFAAPNSPDAMRRIEELYRTGIAEKRDLI